MRNISNLKVTDINHFSSYDLIKYNKETSLIELEDNVKIILVVHFESE